MDGAKRIHEVTQHAETAVGRPVGELLSPVRDALDVDLEVLLERCGLLADLGTEMLREAALAGELDERTAGAERLVKAKLFSIGYDDAHRLSPLRDLGLEGVRGGEGGGA